MTHQIPPLRYIVITRPRRQSKELEKKLQALGQEVFSYPTIQIKKNVLSQQAQNQLKDIASYDWILFTSSNGVKYFIQNLPTGQLDPQLFQSTYIGAVGPKTAEELKKYQLKVEMIPSRFTTDDLARQMKDIMGKKILLPRAAIASDRLTKALEKKGAIVTNIPIYKTEYPGTRNQAFETLVLNNQILCITFTSPSTIEGFIRSIEDQKIKKKIFSLPIISIGPVTTKAAKQYGFGTIHTAKVYTTEGMISMLKELIFA